MENNPDFQNFFCDINQKKNLLESLSENQEQNRSFNSSYEKGEESINDTSSKKDETYLEPAFFITIYLFFFFIDSRYKWIILDEENQSSLRKCLINYIFNEGNNEPINKKKVNISPIEGFKNLVFIFPSKEYLEKMIHNEGYLRVNVFSQ